MSRRDERAELVARMQQIDPYDFEDFVADIWDAEGWETSTSQPSNDRGIDVIAERSGTVNQRLVIQAKRYSEGNKVGRPDVQQYYALKEQETNADAVVVVTTSEFTKDAKLWAHDHNVKLVNGAELADMVKKNGCKHLLSEYESRQDTGRQDRSSTSRSRDEGLLGRIRDSTGTTERTSPTNTTRESSSNTSDDGEQPDFLEGFETESAVDTGTDFLEEFEKGKAEVQNNSGAEPSTSTGGSNRNSNSARNTTSSSSSTEPSSPFASDPGRLEMVTAVVLMQVVGFGLLMAPSLAPGVPENVISLVLTFGWFGSPIAIYRDAKALHASSTDNAPNRLIWPIASMMVPVFGAGYYFIARLD